MKSNLQIGATLLAVDGLRLAIAPANGTDFTLEELQRHVGGYIEVLNLTFVGLMIVNEEGKLQHLPVNWAATEMARKYGGIGADYIVGPAVVCDSAMLT